MILVVLVATPLTDPVSVLPVEDRVVVPMILVDEARPFTVEVRVLPLVVRLLVEAAVIALASEVVARTPLTVELRTTPEVDRALELMILAVDVATPFTEVVIVLAELDTWF